ncbi:dihydrofolate reductase family protein [Amycolatopsis sp. H20-H5]|uniref:dihydrofolate reductase family protein n=1 Tax=Amycolatopsis sp. H20-H5 TaxID=3046309 RepID=UPI002DBF7FC7|nr:dihydrofolate reductase family protein [Amycolatopsis sp. H20-H5]MEC3978471.1 dihydrofolate reductase family protein [Amycolatopsis sp. H20-H5]
MAQALDPAVTLASSDAVAKVRELKRENGKGIWLCGGGGLAAALVTEIDKLVVEIHPVVAGAGIRLFTGDFQPSRWELTDSHVFASGVAAMTSAPRRTS